MSSPTESPQFTEAIDFSKYGLAWTIDDSITKLPDSFFSNISKVTEKQNTMTFLKPNGDTINLKTVEKLGEGSYGKTYLTDYVIDGITTVVKLIDTNSFKRSEYTSLIYDTMQEVLVQILIYESTKSMKFPEIGLQGPFCPRFFCLGKSDDHIYILMESLGRNEMIRFFHNKTKNSKWSLAPARVIKETTLQIAKILGILYNNLKFNHRDLKPDNIMYKLIDGRLNVRLIDFGFSCLTYKNLTLHSTTPGIYSTRLHCKSRSRDIHSYFFYLVNYTEYKKIQNCPVKRVINALCASNTLSPSEWVNTYVQYNFANSNNSPDKSLNVDFDIVYNVFNELVLLSPNKSCSSIEPSWPKHLNIIYENTIPFLEDREYEFTTEAAREPFLLTYLTRYGTEWGRSSDPNAFISSFSYQLKDNTNGVYGKTYFKVSQRLLPELFKKHVEQYSADVDKLGETILHKIARNPTVPEIEDKLNLLITTHKIHAIVHRKNKEGKTALDLAIETNFIYAIEKLSDLVNLLDSNSNLPIIVKLYEINQEKVLSMRSSNGQNIFHFLTQTHSTLKEPFLDKLLENPSSHKLINEPDSSGYYPMDGAVNSNQVYFINKTMQLDPQVTQKNFLFHLASIKDSELVDKLLEKYLDRSIINNKAFEVTPIIYAVHKNNIYLIRKLIELGAKTAIKDNYGRTALHHASVQASKEEPNAFEIVKLLIEANPALPNIKNLNKKGPGNPVFATKKEVRNYIRTRKTGWFTKRKENTNAKKVGGTRRNR